MQSFVDTLSHGKFTKASFAGCDVALRALFPQSMAMLLISVGQKQHEGNKFKATVKLIDRSFQQCLIMVCDTLQRYNLMTQFDLDEVTAKLLAQNAGDVWIQNSQAIFDELLTIPYQIKRWDEIIHHAHYSDFCEITAHFYQTNVRFKQAVAETVELYRQRCSLRHLKFNLDHCIDYLLEECAAMPIFAELGVDFEIYPSGRNPAMAVFYQLYLLKSFPNKQKSVALRFKKYGKEY